MPFNDLRSFIAGAERIGELKVIEGADWDLEIGCITELMAEQEGPLLLFDSIPGYPKGFRIAVNVLATARRFALALGLPTDAPKLEILKTWRRKIRDLKPFAPVEVASGPITENVLQGESVDLDIFPTPKWHERDGGRYIGTGDMVVIKDPESEWINVGTYRSCIVAKDRVTLWIIEHKHGKQLARKYWEAGRACPVAIVLGCEPATWMAAPSAAKAGISEYEYAGALRGAPLEVIRTPVMGLPVPATSEIVIEGEMPPPEAGVAQGRAFRRVARLLYPQRRRMRRARATHPASQSSHSARQSAVVADHRTLRDSALRGAHLGSPGAIRHRRHWRRLVPLPYFDGGDLLKAAYSGHAMQALTAVAGMVTGASMYRYYIAVDDDIDPVELKQVIWAMCTRVDPPSRCR